MAFEQVWKSVTGVPAVDLKDHRYAFVKYTEDGKIVPAKTGDYAVGVNYEPNNVDEPAQVVVQGYAYIILGEEISAGTPVMSDDNGHAVAHTSAAEGTNHVLGVLAVGGEAGDIGTILLR